MADMPHSIDCVCGAEAPRALDAMPDVVMRFRPYEFRKDRNVRSNGQLFGVSDQQHHEKYRRYVDDMKQTQRQAKKAGRKDGQVEWLGTMPGEMCDSISEHDGKETVYKDPVTLLKMTGLYEGDD